MLRIIAVFDLILALGVAGYWYSQGAHPWTATEVLVETEVKDEFGDMTKKEEFVKQFVPGGIDFALPICGFLTVGAAALLFVDKKRRDKASLTIG